MPSIQSNPFPDYSTAYDLIMSKEFLFAIGFIAIMYLNRACWKASYENTHAQRHRYEMLYLDMTQKYLTEQIKSDKLMKELRLLKQTAVKSNRTICPILEERHNGQSGYIM